MPHRHELSDAEWERIAPLLPPLETNGTYYKDHRLILNGMLFRLHTGCPWRDLPERYGPWSTVASRFRRWTSEGLWDLWCIDGTHVRAHRVAAGAGEKSGNPPGTGRTGGPRAGSQPRRVLDQDPSPHRRRRAAPGSGAQRRASA